MSTQATFRSCAVLVAVGLILFVLAIATGHWDVYLGVLAAFCSCVCAYAVYDGITRERTR